MILQAGISISLSLYSLYFIHPYIYTIPVRLMKIEITSMQYRYVIYILYLVLLTFVEYIVHG